MKIFDGVTVNPNSLGPAWQGLIGMGMLLGNTFVEADKERQRRAKEERTQSPMTTLEEVMQQSGLDIPALEDALGNLMGGTANAKAAAAFIVKQPDPVKLLRVFAQDYAASHDEKEPIVTPPPSTAPTPSTAPSAPTSAVPPTAARPKPAPFRPEFTREGMAAAANTTPRPKPSLVTFRPEFTREGMAAVSATASPATAPPAPSAPVSTVLPVPPSPALAQSPARGSSLSDALARRLAVRDRRNEGLRAEIESRMSCVEATAALLAEELAELRRANACPVLFLVPAAEPLPLLVDDTVSPPADDVAARVEEVEEVDEVDETEDDETASSPAPAELLEITGPTTDPLDPLAEESESPIEAGSSSTPVQAEPPAATALAEPVSVEAGEPKHGDATAASEGGERLGSPGVEAADEGLLPPPVDEADLVRAGELLDEYSERTEADLTRQLDRVKSLEGQVNLLRALVARERETGRAASHG